MGWELKQLLSEPTEGLASTTRVFSEGFRATALCLGWKKKGGGDAGRILMFAERLGAGHGLASPFISFSEARHSRPSFTHLGPGSFWVRWAACGHLKLTLKAHGTQHGRLKGSRSPVGMAVRPHCAPPLANEFRGAAARIV